MITLNSRRRLRISASDLRKAGFMPGQRVAVKQDGKNSVEIRHFNKVKRSERVTSYMVEDSGALRMALGKFSKRIRTAQVPSKVSVSRSRIELSF